MSQTKLYFFDFERQNRRKKRYRKPPELLPFSVGLTGLSGALRVEAYLKQHKEKALRESKDGETSEQGKRSGYYGGILDKSTSNQDAKRALERSQKQSFHYSPGGANSSYFIRSFDQVDGDDEDEDTQRFLFEENKFAAPNLLAQLGKILNDINERLLRDQQEIRAVKGQLAGISTYNPLEESENELKFFISLPDDLYNKLLWNYEEFSANAVYVKREWQTASYREQAILSQRLGNITETQETEKKMEPEKDREKDSKKKSKPNLDKLTEKPEHDGAGTPLGTETGSSYDPPPAVGLRRESRIASSQNSRPRTRLEKFKYLPDKKLALMSARHEGAASMLRMRRNTSTVAPTEAGSVSNILVEEDEKGFVDKNFNITYLKDIPRFPGKQDIDFNKELKEREIKDANITGSPQIINFSLMSKHCEEKGWFLHATEGQDPERQTLIEWARARLLQAIKQKEEEDQKAKLRGEDGELVAKYYGDTKRELTLKYKQGVSWAKRLKKLADQEKKVKFLTALPDGSTSIYYPSGRLAISRTVSGLGIGTHYVHVYSDHSYPKMLAVFAPTGVACCYRTNGSIKFISTAKFGAVMDEEGSVTRKWKWPIGKLQVPLSVQLNSHISLRVVSHHSFTIMFSCAHELWKCSVGLNDNATPMKEDSFGHIQMEEMPYTSNTALQAIRIKKKMEEVFVPKSRRKRKGQKQDKNVLTEERIEQRQQELNKKFPERKAIEMEILLSDVDLHKIQRKVKDLVHQWMDHYRIAVGIKMRTTVVERRTLTHSAKSLPGAMPSKRREKRTMYQYRAPSAPPQPRSLMRGADTAETGRPHSSMDSRQRLETEGASLRLDVPQDTRSQYLMQEERAQTMLSSMTPGLISSTERLPFRCGTVQQPRQKTPPPSGCAPALRSQILGERDAQCRCDCRHMPFITDLEYDEFINCHVPRTQLIVVSVVSSIYPDASPCDEMLDEVYYEKNKNRTVPCLQSRSDPFRLVRYDMAVAAFQTGDEEPLLYRRHNAIPGMFLMYIGGKLMFADHIFNGYGKAKKDFLKQVMKSRKESLEGVSLPPDFRLSPSRGRSGPRAAWGGEIGGTSGLVAIPLSPTMAMYAPRPTSTATSDSLPFEPSRTGTAKSAVNFIRVGLSIDSPFSVTTLPRSPDVTMQYADKTIRPHTVATKS